MAQQPAHKTILPVLEAYLERKDVEFWGQTGSKRSPTLPTTGDNKVNVRQLVLDLMLEPGGKGVIRESHQQHFFNKEELANAVNAMAIVQGIGQIGSRALSSKDDAIIRGQISTIKQSAKAENEAFVEIAAENARLRQENASLLAERRFIQETGSVLRDGVIKT